MSTSSGDGKTIEVITISDDEDEHNSANLEPVADEQKNNSSPDSSFFLPQIQDVFQVEEYFLPPRNDSSDNHLHNPRSKESFSGISENQITVQETLIEQECLNSLVGDVAPPYQISGEQTIISFQELSSETNQQAKRNSQLERLAKDLSEIVLVSLGKKQSNITKLSNLEKTIWEVSQSDFDISECVPPRRSKMSWSYENILKTPPSETCTNDSTMGTFEKSVSLNKSQTLRSNEQTPTDKKKRGRPFGWRKNKSKGDKISDKIRRDENFNLNDIAVRYKDVSFSAVQSVINRNSEVGTDNKSQRKRQDSHQECDEEAPLETRVYTVRSTKGVIDNQDTSTITFEQEKSNYTARHTSMTVIDSHNSTNQENFTLEGLNVNQENEDSGEICQFPENSASINNVIPKESDVKTSSTLSSAAELTLQDLGSNQCDTELAKNLSEGIDPDDEISQTEFVICYNRTFVNHVTNLCLKMSDLIFLSMQEEDSYKQRLVATEKLTCEELREKEKETLKTSFLKAYNENKMSFSLMFQHIVDVILSNASSVKLQKMLLLSWFLKLFSKITLLLPEYSDNHALIWKKINNLLSNYENPSPLMKEIFSLSEVDFEKEFWETLNFIQQSFSEDSIPEITSDSEIPVKDTRAAKLPETPCYSMEPPEMQSDGSSQSLSNPSVTFLGKICETEVQNVNYNAEKVDILYNTSHQKVPVIVNQQLTKNIFVTAAQPEAIFEAQPESSNSQLASQDHQSNCKVAVGPATQKDTSTGLGAIHYLIETIIEEGMKNTYQSDSPTHRPDITHPENATNLSFKNSNSTVIESVRECGTSSTSMKRKADTSLEHTNSKIVKICAEKSIGCTRQSKITNVVDIRTTLPPVSTNVPCTTQSFDIPNLTIFKQFNTTKNQSFYNSVNQRVSKVRPDKHYNNNSQSTLNTSGGVPKNHYSVSSVFRGYSRSYPRRGGRTRGSFIGKIVNTKINFQNGPNFNQGDPNNQNFLPQSNAPPTVTKHVNGYQSKFQSSLHTSQTHQYRQDPQLQYSRTNSNEDKIYQSKNQQMLHPVNMYSYPMGVSHFKNRSLQSTEVFKPNQVVLNQTTQSILHTTQTNFATCVSDFTENLRNQVASGARAISSVKELQTSEENCQDKNQTVVPEVLPKQTLHYKPDQSRSNFFLV